MFSQFIYDEVFRLATCSWWPWRYLPNFSTTSLFRWQLANISLGTKLERKVDQLILVCFRWMKPGCSAKYQNTSGRLKWNKLYLCWLFKTCSSILLPLPSHSLSEVFLLESKLQSSVRNSSHPQPDRSHSRKVSIHISVSPEVSIY